MEAPQEKLVGLTESEQKQPKNQEVKWPLPLGIAIMTTGIGTVFGVAVYVNTKWILDGNPFEGADTWASLIGEWLVVVGAFTVLLALLFKLLRKRLRH